MADETMAEDVFMAHMERAVRRSQEIWPDDWRNHHTFYDGEVARLLDTLRQADEPRAIVRAFARAMERKLAANDGLKGGWKKAHWFTLYRCMVMEKAELLNALEALDSVLAKIGAFNDRFEGGELLSRIDADEDELLRQLDTAKRDVLQEAADVSNYAMMIADVCGALPPTDERGR